MAEAPTGLGHVPDFRRLHADWERNMAAAKRRQRQRLTVPQEFRLNGRTKEEQVKAAQREEERREKILEDIQVGSGLKGRQKPARVRRVVMVNPSRMGPTVEIRVCISQCSLLVSMAQRMIVTVRLHSVSRRHRCSSLSLLPRR